MSDFTYLLQEDDFYLLQEDSFRIILELPAPTDISEIIYLNSTITTEKIMESEATTEKIVYSKIP